MPAKVKHSSKDPPSTKDKKGSISQNELLDYMSNIGLKSHTQDSLPQKVKINLPHKKLKKETQKMKNRKIPHKKINRKSVVANTTKPDTKLSHSRPLPAPVPLRQIKTPLILNDSLWYEMQNILYDSLNLKSGNRTKGEDGIFQEAELLLSRDKTAYKSVQEKMNKSDHEWIQNILVTGTLSDKFSAHVLLIQESPIHNLISLSALLHLAGKNEKRVALGACDSLRQLWRSTLLPDRKLKTFGEYIVGLQSLKSNQDKECALIFAVFEHKLKEYYLDFIKIIKRHAHDSVTEVKAKSIDYIFEMLAMKPEQEQILLTALVDKISDPAKKVASKAQYLLFKLIQLHPNMKYVVCEEVERLLNRSSASEKAQRYGFTFLNQIILAQGDVELSNKLLNIYFAFFQVYSTKNEANWKILSSLLSGVQRAYPFSNLKDDKLFSEQIGTLFKVVHVGTFSTSLQSLIFLFQILDTKPQIADRYYQALYSKIFDREMVSSNKHTIFLNLIFRTCKADPMLDRNKAFVKRLLQSTVFHRTNYSCGLLYLLEKLFQSNISLSSLITESIARDSEEETFRDLDSSGEENQECEPPQVPRYELRTRNPLYCRAGYSCLWEISLLEKHFHPSVRSFATQLRSCIKSDYEGDPLESFSVIRFLDKFVYKTPKKRPQGQGISLMQKSKSKERANRMPVNSAAFLSMKPDSVPEDELFYYQYFKLQEHKLNKKKKKQQDITDKLLTSDGEDVEESKESALNFMSNIKQKIKKNKRNKGEYEGRSSSDSDLEFNDSDIVSSGDEFLEGGFNKEKYEKMLIQEANSDEEKSTENPEFDSSLFAAADEFSHLIEEGISEDTEYKKKNKKRLKISVKPRENKKRKPLSKLEHAPKKKPNEFLRKRKFGKPLKSRKN